MTGLTSSSELTTRRAPATRRPRDGTPRLRSAWCSRCWRYCTTPGKRSLIAVAFDNPIRSFRNKLFKHYKSDEGVPPDLLAQFDAVEEAIRCIGIVVWSMREHEADDALASGARRFRDETDKDLQYCGVPQARFENWCDELGVPRLKTLARRWQL